MNDPHNVLITNDTANEYRGISGVVKIIINITFSHKK